MPSQRRESPRPDVTEVVPIGKTDWVVGGDRDTAAAERIYRAATDLVLAKGMDALDVDEMAARLQCSRATVYRHAGGKAHIRDVVLVRLASGVVDTVRRAVDGVSGTDRVITAVRVALEQIRSDPIRRLMTDGSGIGQLKDLHESPLLSRLAAELTGITDSDAEAARWIVRIVMSFAQWPPQDAETELRLLCRFVAPAFG